MKWGFVRIGKDQWIITKDDTNARLYMEDPNNCKYIISVEYVGLGENVIPNI